MNVDSKKSYLVTNIQILKLDINIYKKKRRRT